MALPRKLTATETVPISRGLAGLDRAPPAWVLVTAGLCPLLLVGGWLAAGAVQPGYSPVRETVSALAGQAGTHPWIVTGALFAVGGCYLATAAGLAGLRIPARVLLAVAGLSSIGIAASPEPVTGSTPQHLAWTVLGAATITVWPAFTVRRGPGQAGHSQRALRSRRDGGLRCPARLAAGGDAGRQPARPVRAGDVRRRNDVAVRRRAGRAAGRSRPVEAAPAALTLPV